MVEEVPLLKRWWGSNYVGNESGQIALLSLARWVKPLLRPRFPRLSDNKWLPTLRLSVFCFLSNKTRQRAGERERERRGSWSDRRVGKGERGPPWSAVICLTQSFKGGQFGLFSPSPMNGCRQGISDGCDKISHPRCPALQAPKPDLYPWPFQVTRLTVLQELVLKDGVRWSLAEMLKCSRLSESGKETSGGHFSDPPHTVMHRTKAFLCNTSHPVRDRL